MTELATFIISVDALQAVMATLPTEAQQPESGIFYDDGTLHVPERWVEQVAESVAAAVAPGASDRRRHAALRAYAADKRYAVETGGLVVGGRRIDTSRDSQALITGAHAYVSAADVPTVEFKAAGGWVTLTRADVQGIALAVAAHVQACFAVERAIDTAIEADEITSTTEIDAANWPA